MYKSCCNRRCLLGTCKVRDAGGCYCVCLLVDQINTLESCISGIHLDYGGIYIPDEEKRKSYYEKKSQEEKDKQEHFRNVDAPLILDKLKKKLEECTNET